MASNLTIKNLPPELLEDFKAFCAFQKLSLRDCVIKCMKEHVECYHELQGLHEEQVNNRKK